MTFPGKSHVTLVNFAQLLIGFFYIFLKKLKLVIQHMKMNSTHENELKLRDFYPSLPNIYSKDSPDNPPYAYKEKIYITTPLPLNKSAIPQILLLF